LARVAGAVFSLFGCLVHAESRMRFPKTRRMTKHLIILPVVYEVLCQDKRFAKRYSLGDTSVFSRHYIIIVI